MKRTDADYHIGNLFQSGNPLTGQRGTRLEHTWLNNVQEELITPLEAADIVPDGGDTGQLLRSLRRLGLGFDTLALALADAAPVGTIVSIHGHTTPGDGGEFIGVVKAANNALYPSGGNICPLSDITFGMYGAKADGSDDAQALRDAGAAAKAKISGSNLIRDHGGTYTVGSTVALQQISFIGSGDATEITGNFAGAVLEIGGIDGNNRTFHANFKDFAVRAGALCTHGIIWGNMIDCKVDVTVYGDDNCLPNFIGHWVSGATHGNTWMLRGKRDLVSLPALNSDGIGVYVGGGKQRFGSPSAGVNSNVFSNIHMLGFERGVILAGADNVGGNIFYFPLTEGGDGTGFTLNGGFSNRVISLWDENQAFGAISLEVGNSTTPDENGVDETFDGFDNSIEGSAQAGIGFNIAHQRDLYVLNVRVSKPSTMDGATVRGGRCIYQTIGTGTLTGQGDGMLMDFVNAAAQQREFDLGIYGTSAGIKLYADTATSYIAGTANNETIAFPTFGQQGIEVSEIHPDIDNAVSCGTAARRFSEIFSANSAVNTSDAREKRTRDDEYTEIMTLASAISTVQLHAFQWLNSIEKKGDGARVHIGAYAQEIEAAIRAAGLDPSRYALWCRDEITEWQDVDGVPTEVPVIDPDTGEARYRLGLRHDQIIALSLIALKAADARRVQDIADLSARLDALEKGAA